MHPDSKYLIQGAVYRGDSRALQVALGRVYGTEERPRCLCVEAGVEMYVAKHARFVIKRMPETGPDHHVACGSFEVPASDSGLGELLGEAIVERAPDLLAVRLDFPLSHLLSASPRGAPPESSPSVSAARKRLSIRALLHLLWERAGFNRWSPKMEGKRTWYVIRKYLLEAAAEIEVNGARLDTLLFVPEPYRPEEAEALRARRAAFFEGLVSDYGPERQPLALVVGEVKDLSERAGVSGLTIKHMPDCALSLDGATARHVLRRFEGERLLKAQQPNVRLVVASTVQISPVEGLHVDTLTLMTVTPEWIPFDHPLELALLSTLVREKRRFMKPLRYDAARSSAFADVLLLDLGSRPVPLDVVLPSEDRHRRQAKEAAIAARDTRGWVWRPEESFTMPPLPHANVIAGR